MAWCSRFDQKRSYQRHLIIGSVIPAVFSFLLMGAHYALRESAFETSRIPEKEFGQNRVPRPEPAARRGRVFFSLGSGYTIVPDDPTLAKLVDPDESETPEPSYEDKTDDLLAGFPMPQFQIPTMELEQQVSFRDRSKPPSVKTRTSLDGVLRDNVTVVISIDSLGKVVPPPDNATRTVTYYVRAAENKEVVFHVERGETGDVNIVMAEIARFWEFYPALDKDGKACSGELRLRFIPIKH